MEKESQEPEKHFIDVILCDRLGTGKKVCEYQKDITIVTEHGGLHQLITVCEKHLAVNPNLIFCYGLKRARITAIIELMPEKRKRVNNVTRHQ